MKDLQVEKRRIYDVFNILEAFRVIFRVEKNKYLWCGLNSISKTLACLENDEPVPEDPVFGQFKAKANKKKMLTSLSTRLTRLFIKSQKEKPCMTLEEAAKNFCG